MSRFLSPGESAPVEHMRKCSASRRDGSHCEGVAMRGSEVCRMHGGSAPQVREAAARRVTADETTVLMRQRARPRKTTPVDALEEELARTQGYVDWLAERVGDNPAESVWMSLLQAEQAQLAKLAAGMLTAKTDLRKIELSANAVEALDRVLRGVLADFRLDPDDPRVGASIARHLAELGTRTGVDVRGPVPSGRAGPRPPPRARRVLIKGSLRLLRSGSCLPDRE